MPTWDEATRYDALEHELAEVVARIDHVNQELRLFGRLGFCAQQMRLELLQLEKRRVGFEQALQREKQESPKSAAVNPRQVGA